MPPAGIAVEGTLDIKNGALLGQVVAVGGDTLMSSTFTANVAEQPLASE